jgi:hypothetical protein
LFVVKLLQYGNLGPRTLVGRGEIPSKAKKRRKKEKKKKKKKKRKEIEEKRRGEEERKVARIISGEER